MTRLRLARLPISKLGEVEFKQIGQLKLPKLRTLYESCNGLNGQTLAHLTAPAALEELGTDGMLKP